MQTIVLDNFFQAERTTEIGHKWMKTDNIKYMTIEEAEIINEKHREIAGPKFIHKYRISLIQTVQTIILED
jgi:hypothetical protein